MKSYAILACLFSAFLVCPTISSAQNPISLENWTTHPGVKEVRSISDEIQNGIKSKTYKTKVRRFDVESDRCSTYPKKSEILAVDLQNRTRMYQHETIGSHREPFTVERYYDTKGKLRFVFVDYRNTNIRVYLDRGGRVFWGIEKNRSEIRRYDTNNDYWETKPNSAIGAMKEFQEEQLCPEITK